ncbi:Tma23p NDAI_0K00500 [Naumovozyma dairenensis CBS 421]|uniref:G-patch domain-containing protein n=1 Tax=Naumovozyma dairenensis (strain ATCC 10597 / BCRC 20456 / CBS 421 / NBRC 0211 / NRRL Y-12639) TaxID=1071378 RepID=G0WHI0_NAUDC|nr:hypothetical protein NDAI_0K00500 [Naumovozyma dairenensis CBS 421]CCD27241.1 hypothetical protein NDAI_0K00500 [Naumovozyma dairenensis CBS 421]
MNGKDYLKSYGWIEGEALRKGGLKKPILVKYKKDTKGLGCAPGNDDSEAWWERLFDGHLKNLDVSNGGKKEGITFNQKEKVVATAISKQSSPLYRRFVRGVGLKGTIDNDLGEEATQMIVSDMSSSKKKSDKKRKRDDDDYDDKLAKRTKKIKKSKKKDKKKDKQKAKKEKRAKKDKKEKKHEKKKNKKGKKEKKRSKKDEKLLIN